MYELPWDQAGQTHKLLFHVEVKVACVEVMKARVYCMDWYKWTPMQKPCFALVKQQTESKG